VPHPAGYALHPGVADLQFDGCALQTDGCALHPPICGLHFDFCTVHPAVYGLVHN
jgi:hypothetical protein